MSARVETRAPLQTVHESGKMDEANVNPRHVQPSRSCRHGTNEEQPHIGKYRLIKTIGKGNFAKVNASLASVLLNWAMNVEIFWSLVGSYPYFAISIILPLPPRR